MRVCTRARRSIWWHDLSGRSGRTAFAHAGEAAEGAGDGRVHPRRSQPVAEDGCPYRSGDECKPQGGGSEREVPGRPLLPAQYGTDRGACAAYATGRRALAFPPIRRRQRREVSGTNIQDLLIGPHNLECPWRPSDLAQRLGRIVRQGNENDEVEIYRYVTEGTFDAYLYQLVENKQKFISQIMTGKTPVRAMEDVDETALSFAEIKALATGNPLIIEKCNLDMEVGKLNMLKASFLNQKYAMEELVLRRYPETIKRLTERILGYEKDLETAGKNPKPKEGFAGMILNGRAYMDKEEAGKEILELCTRLTKDESSLSGEYRGFDLTLSYDGFSNEYRMHMKGQLSHIAVLGSDVYGNITRMDNVIDSFSEKLQKVKDELSETKIQLENAKEEMEAGHRFEPCFAHQ